MKILVCGSRNYFRAGPIYDDLDHYRQRAETRGESFYLIHGARPTGADLHANAWAIVNKLPLGRLTPYPANWERDGKAAGPIRNQMMIDAQPDLVLAYANTWPLSPGTSDMVSRAARAGVEVRLHVWPGNVDLTPRPVGAAQAARYALGVDR